MSALMSLMNSQGPPPQGPPPAAEPDVGADNAPGGDWEADLQKVVADLRALMGDAADHQEHAIVAQCYAQLQKLLGARQGQAESALGVQPAHKALSRAYSQ